MDSKFAKDMYIGQLEFGDFVFGSVEIAEDGTFSMSFNILIAKIPISSAGGG